MSYQPMNTPHWRSEDGQLLQSLREKAGLDELVFARTNTVSLAQLRELEQGGESSFYNPQIKRSTGVKLLRKLGHELPPAPVPVQSLAPVSDPDDIAPRPATDGSPLHDSTPAILSEQGTSSSNAGRTAGRKRSTMFWGFGLSTLALFAVVAATYPKTKTSPFSKPAMASVPTDAPQPTLTQAPPLPASLIQSAPTPTASPPTGAPAPETSAVTPTNTASVNPTRSVHLDCDWQHRDSSTVFQQTAPLKPGNYVHFVAQADTTLCVLDQHNKLTTLSLAEGAAKSVHGVAPFLVHSSGWQNLTIFFQGRRVHAVREGNQHLQLLSQAF